MIFVIIIDICMSQLMYFKSPYSFSNKFRRFLWQVVWHIFARPLPRSLGNTWKLFLLRLFGAKVASTSVVYSRANIFAPWNLVMGEYACLADGVICYNTCLVKLEDRAIVSQRTYLCTASHDINDINHSQVESPIVICSNAWVAAEAFIGPGVIIGEGAVVGARGCVFRNVNPWTVVGGNPAKIISYRSFEKA